jgi:hypothetical protein
VAACVPNKRSLHWSRNLCDSNIAVHVHQRACSHTATRYPAVTRACAVCKGDGQKVGLGQHMSSTTVPTHSIFWFRKGLRLHDNPALLAAIRGSSYLFPVFILDPWFLKPERVGVNRLNFLLESLSGAGYIPCSNFRRVCRSL